MPELFAKVRSYGVGVEQELLQATKGVNTQRGILFAGGLVAAAAGYALKTGATGAKGLCRIVSGMTDGLVKKELVELRADRPLTAGEKLYRTHGVTGIRGEVEAGFPSVLKAGLPALRRPLHKVLV